MKQDFKTSQPKAIVSLVSNTRHDFPHGQQALSLLIQWLVTIKIRAIIIPLGLLCYAYFCLVYTQIAW